MEKTVVTISVENTISVVVMAVIGFTVIGLIFKIINTKMGKSDAAN